MNEEEETTVGGEELNTTLSTTTANEHQSTINSQSKNQGTKRMEAPIELTHGDPVIGVGGIFDPHGVVYAIATSPTPVEDGLLDERLEAELASVAEKLEEKCAVLERRTRILKEWIASAFNVHDIPAWINEHQKRKEERSNPDNPTVSTGTVVSSTTAATTIPTEVSTSTSQAAAAAPKPTTLRLKIGNIAKESVSQPPARGTGSKNLSRMNRPKSKGGSSCAMSSGANNPNTQDKAKVTNQTSIAVFWNYVEAYFKNLDESVDLKFLDDSAHIVDPTPFTIPALGRRYEEQWYDQNGYVVEHYQPPHQQQGTDQSPKRPRLAITPAISLRDRILSMLVEAPDALRDGAERVDPNDTIDDGAGEPIGDESTEENEIPTSTIALDDRIRRDLCSLGFPEFSEATLVDQSEDDPICVEMRKLQAQLREQVCINHYRKAVLAAIVREHLPAQEFYSLMTDLDKQIEHFYQKRMKGGKRKKKGGGASEPSGAALSGNDAASANETGLRLLETRARLIDAFSSIIPPLPQVLSSRSPSDPVFDEAAEARVLETASKSGNWLPIPLVDPLQSRPTQPVFPQTDL